MRGGGGGSDDNLCGSLTVKAKKSTSQLLATIEAIKELSRHLLLKKADSDIFCRRFTEAFVQSLVHLVLYLKVVGNEN
jgi:hypothetical protein